MEVFPQLGQNQFGFKVEYDKFPEKIPKFNCEGRE